MENKKDATEDIKKIKKTEVEEERIEEDKKVEGEKESNTEKGENLASEEELKEKVEVIKKRLNVTLREENVAKIKKYAKENGTSVSELLDEYVDNLEEFKKYQKKKESGLINTLEEAEEQIEEALYELEDAMKTWEQHSEMLEKMDIAESCESGTDKSNEEENSNDEKEEKSEDVDKEDIEKNAEKTSKNDAVGETSQSNNIDVINTWLPIIGGSSILIVFILLAMLFKY